MSNTYTEITCREIFDQLDDIKKTDTAIWRKNARGEYVPVRLEMLQPLFDNKSWDKKFFIDGDWKKRLNTMEIPQGEYKSSSGGEEKPPHSQPKQPTHGPKPVSDGGFNSIFQNRMDNIQARSISDRNAILDKNIRKLKARAESDEHDPFGLVKEGIKIVTDFFMVALTTMKDQQEKRATETDMTDIVEKTDHFIDVFVGLLRKHSIRYSDLNIIEKVSIKSQTFDHISKVFLRFILFGFYYDTYFQNNKIKGIESRLPEYIEYYRRVQPSFKSLTLADVGLQRISKPMMKRFTLGVLLHDTGKLLNIDYHEGNLPYVREKVVGHAALGYNMLIKSKAISQEVAAVAALHHEYYLHESGYGVSRFLFPVVREKLKQPNPIFNTFMSLNFEDVKNGRSLAYFPAKLLEVHDVFDGLTNRCKPNPHTPEDALKIMEEDFIENAVKLDPILFTIFKDFIAEYLS